MSKYLTEVTIEIKGDADRKLGTLARSFQRFSRDSNRALRGVGSGLVGFSNQLDHFGGKYAIFLGSIAGGAMLKRVGDVEHKLLRMRLAAGESSEGMQKASNNMYDAARRYGVGVDEIMGGVETIIAKTGNYKMAIDMMDLLGKSIGGGFSSGEDMGAIISNLSDKLKIDNVKDMTEALNLLAQQADVGSVEFRNMAGQAEVLTAAYAATGNTGMAGLRSMGADLQIVAKSVPIDRLSTAFSAMYRQLYVKQKELKKMGVSIYDPKALAKGNYVLRDTFEIMQEIKKVTKGDPALIQELAGDEGARAWRAMMNASEQVHQNLKAGKNEAGQLGKALDFKAEEQRKSFNGAIQSFNAAVEKLAVNKLTPAIQALANAINGLADSPDIFNKLAGGATGLGALYLGNKGVRGAIGATKEVAKWVAPEARAASGLAGAAKGMAGAGRFAAGTRGAMGLLGKLGLPLQLLMGAVDIGGAAMSGSRDQMYGALGRTGGGILGGWGGGLAGAGIGTMIMPGIGTAIGGVAGGILGGVGGSFGGGALGAGISQAMTAADIEQAMLRANNQTTKKDMMEVGLRLELKGNPNFGASLNVIDFLNTGDSDVRLGRVAIR